MPTWVWFLIGAIVVIGAALYFYSSGTFKLPSGNVATAPAAVNASGTQYGNLT